MTSMPYLCIPLAFSKDSLFECFIMLIILVAPFIVLSIL